MPQNSFAQAVKNVQKIWGLTAPLPLTRLALRASRVCKLFDANKCFTIQLCCDFVRHN